MLFMGLRAIRAREFVTRHSEAPLSIPHFPFFIFHFSFSFPASPAITRTAPSRDGMKNEQRTTKNAKRRTPCSSWVCKRSARGSSSRAIPRHLSPFCIFHSSFLTFHFSFSFPASPAITRTAPSRDGMKNEQRTMKNAKRRTPCSSLVYKRSACGSSSRGASRVRTESFPLCLETGPVEHQRVDDPLGPAPAGQVNHALAYCPADVAEQLVRPRNAVRRKRTLSRSAKRLGAVTGSWAKQSSAAPAMRRFSSTSYKASSSTIPPRAVLIR